MSKLHKVLLSISATALMAVPMAGPILSPLAVNAQSTVQNQAQGLVSLGASLTAAQAQQTLQLLGASNYPQSSIKYIDGNIINQYLQDGSNASTVVYSSAYIQPMPEGFGVQVQIVTPNNITKVSQLTYQNAAITAGAKNALIRVATVSPVTGEGALTGVYALLAQSGVKVQQKDVKVAQKEITLVNDIQQKTGAKNATINQALADVKTEVTNTIINNNTTVINDETINNIVIKVVQKNNINLNDYPDLLQQLKDYAKQYADTDAAKNKDTVTQLEQSTTPVWSDVLVDLDEKITTDQAAAMAKVNFDGKKVMPEIQSLANRFYADRDAGLSATMDYAYSFVFETLNPQMTVADKSALNDVRTAIFAYAMGQENALASETGMTASLKQRWMDNLIRFENLKVAQPNLAEIYTQVGLQTGLMPQVLSYQVTDQEGSVVSLKITEDLLDHTNTYNYTYDLATGQVMDNATGTPTPVTPMDYSSTFGSAIKDNRNDKVTLPADYQIPTEYIGVDGQPVEIIGGESSAESAEATRQAPVDTTAATNHASSESTEEMTTTPTDTTAATTVGQSERAVPATDPVWSNILVSLDASTTSDQFAAMAPVSFEGQTVMPQIQSLANHFYSDSNAGANATIDYAYSFALESLNPQMTDTDKGALNDVRMAIFAYAMGQENSLAAQTGQPATLKQRWADNFAAFENLKTSQPILAEIFTQVGIKTGLMPQVYSYQVTGQEGTMVTIEVKEDLIDHTNTYRYVFDLASGQVLENVTGTPTPVTAIDYSPTFGSPLQDKRTNKVTIPADYQVPQEFIVAPVTTSETETPAQPAPETSPQTNEATNQEVPLESQLETPDTSQTTNEGADTLNDLLNTNDGQGGATSAE